MKTCTGCGRSGGLRDFARYDTLCHGCRERKGPRSVRLSAAEKRSQAEAEWLSWAGLRLEATDGEIAEMCGVTIGLLRYRFQVLRGRGYELPRAKRSSPHRMVRRRTLSTSNARVLS